MSSAYDFSATLNQSTCNKVVESTSYPLTAFEHSQNFPGCANLALTDEGAFYVYSDEEIEQLLVRSVEHVRSKSNRNVPSVYDDLYSFGGSIIQQARKTLEALQTAPKEGPESYEGPSEEVLKGIIDGGIQNLVKTLKPLGDWGLYAWNPYLRVIVRERPEISLNSPRIDLSNVKIEVTATGELWSKFPWFNCYRWCTKWEKVIKCEKIASLTVSPHIKAKLHANVRAEGARVGIFAEFDELRLDYQILDKIPLEGIANRALSNKTLFVYDASQLVATVPVLQSRFSVDSIKLPQIANGIEVGVTIKKL